MKPITEANKFRFRIGYFGSNDSDGNNGAFIIPYNKKINLACVVSDGEGWDHVSIHVVDKRGCIITRCPTWDEMLFVKDLFFEKDEWTVQYMPPKSKNINVHNYTLHIWKPQDQELPKPPVWLV